MVSPRLAVAAIHNGELEHSPSAAVLSALRPLTHSYIEVSEQQPFTDSPNRGELLRWRRRQAHLERRWSAHIEQPAQALKSSFGSMVFRFRIQTSKSCLSDAWLTRQVEKAVTAKHIAAWRAFAETETDELLVLESDAVLTPSTEHVVQDLVNRQDRLPRYVNLAGGLDPLTIGIHHLRITESNAGANNGLSQFRVPVTNTSCAYLINRDMTRNLLSHLESHPMDSELGIDWLFNALFLASEPKSITCIHAEPPAIGHGSMTGVTQSWHPNR